VLLNMTPDVFDSPASLPHIIGLLGGVQDGRHVWVAGDDELAAAEAYMRTQVPNLADSYISLARKGAVQVQWVGTVERPSAVTVQSDNLTELAHDLSRPAILVVEDHNSDGSFLITLCKIFGVERPVDALSRGWLEIRHGGGGGSLPSVTMTEIGLFKTQIRVAAMMDSDRLLPGERTDAHDKADMLRKSGAVVHVLELREIENYIPNRALAAVRPHRTSSNRLKFLKELSSDQRGVYDMKIGFGPASSSPKIPPKQIPIFANLSQQTLRGLRSGFGKNVAGCMTQMVGSLTERDFGGISASVVAEIRTLLQNIAGIL
jgi:hypothetical protein